MLRYKIVTALQHGSPGACHSLVLARLTNDGSKRRGKRGGARLHTTRTTKDHDKNQAHGSGENGHFIYRRGKLNNSTEEIT